MLKLKIFEKKMILEIVPVWTTRNHSRIIQADIGSKFSADEWGLSREILQDIFSKFNFTPSIDCFASSEIQICSTFFSKIPQLGSSGVNFFAQSLDDSEEYFCFPPTKLIDQLFEVFVSHPEISGLIIVPAWKSSAFWPVIYSGNWFHPRIKSFLSFKARFVVFNNSNSGGVRKFSPGKRIQEKMCTQRGKKGEKRKRGEKKKKRGEKKKKRGEKKKKREEKTKKR